MRVKLTFRAIRKGTAIPINYNYAVSSLIYKTVAESSPGFAEELHDRGFTSDSRQFRLFTFSRIYTRNSRIDEKQKLIKLLDPHIELKLSSPVSEFLNHFVQGLFAKSSFFINHGEFVLTHAETIETPLFKEKMRFRALSPITESTRNEENKVHFLTLADNWSEIITRNLRRKFEALFAVSLPDAEVKWEWDEDYLANHTYERKASRLIDLNGIKVRGWLAPFTVKGSIDLIKIGYAAGFGSRNSMGFGMAEVWED